ncbi:MAG: hypothetical protein K0R29_616 [Pseudobdellovibrio sp.]|jgi:hypothetical protein|nr:hypothetical protein [Pseudobdellovibrio sp.]
MTNVLVFTGLFLAAVLSRLVPHGWNFTLMGAVFIFAGAYFKDRKISLALMLSSLLVSDFFIGFHAQMPAVYAGFLAMIAVGIFLNVDSSRVKILAYSFAAALAFFLISNFGVWLEGQMYAMTFKGLIECYVMGIPFFWRQMIGDVGFSLTLFELAKRLLAEVPAKAEATVEVESDN